MKLSEIKTRTGLKTGFNKDVFTVRVDRVTLKEKHDKTGHYVMLDATILAPDTVKDLEGNPINVGGETFSFRGFDTEKGWASIIDAYKRIGRPLDELVSADDGDTLVITGLKSLEGAFLEMVLWTTEDIPMRALTEEDLAEGKKPEPLKTSDGNVISRGHKIADWCGFNEIYNELNALTGVAAATGEQVPSL